MILKKIKALAGILTCSILLMPSISFAGVHLTVQGSSNNFNLGLQEQTNTSASGSVAIDMGSHVRLGLTHRVDVSDQKGFSDADNDVGYLFSQTRTTTTANSVDLTLILYYGQVFVPYIMGGLIVKNYIIEYASEASPVVRSTAALPPSPNAGFGLGIRLNKAFSLKLSFSVSPGVRQTHPDAEAQGALDRVSSIGITYNI